MEKMVECIVCGEWMHKPVKGRRQYCEPCLIERRREYLKKWRSNPNKIVKVHKQRKNTKQSVLDEINSKKGHLEAFMGLDYADQLV